MTGGGGDLGHDRARVVTSQVVEGDAAMFVDGASLGTWVDRRSPAPQSGRFTIEQQILAVVVAQTLPSESQVRLLESAVVVSGLWWAMM